MGSNLTPSFVVGNVEWTKGKSLSSSFEYAGSTPVSTNSNLGHCGGR